MTEPELKSERKETARREIGRTEITRPAAWALVGVFVATILAVPAAQHVHDLSRRPDWPQCYDIFRSLPPAGRVLADSERSLFRRIFDANSLLLRDINRFEDALEDEALLRNALLPPAQAVFTRVLGVGNEEAYCARHGWLFYRPGIDYVTGPGFLEPSRLAARAESGNEWTPDPQPDPVEAIADFAAELALRDIRLVIVPTPIKPMIHPEKFRHAYEGHTSALQNPSYDEFKRRLTERLGGTLLIFDVAQTLVDRKRETGRPQYLATDTHWRPDAMELSAEKLAGFIAQHVALPERTVRYKRRATDATNVGDIARMLKLPKSQTLYPKETVRIQQVFDQKDNTWRADKESDVLLLGDSFSNVYSYEAMGWGFSAGLAEHLSYYMRRPLDRIVRNDDGAYAARQTLANELAKGRDRLAGKKLVIWQFAARELARGDWKLLDLTLRKPEPSAFFEPEAGREAVVSGVIARVAPVPRPYSRPYKDYILVLHLTDLRDDKGPAAAKEAVVYMWGMRDNRWTEPARFRTDQEVTLRVRSWDELIEKDRDMGTINRADPGEELELEPACWGEVARE